MDEIFFRATFDGHIWPLFCQLLAGQTRGLCLIEGGQGTGGTNGAQATDLGSASIQRYPSLLAWLVGMPVLGAGWELHSLELSERAGARKGPAAERLWPLPAKHAASRGGANEPSACSRFVAACTAYAPPTPEDLAPFRDEIRRWLRRRDRAFVRQLYQLKVASGQETAGTFRLITPAEAQQPRKQAAKTVPMQRENAR